MKLENSKAIVNLTGALFAGSSVTTSIMAYLEANATAIGALCSIIFGVIYVIFQILNHRKLTIANSNKIEIDDIRDRMIRMEESLKSINDKLN